MSALHTLISPETLATRLDDHGLCIFDCRFDLADSARGWRDYMQAHIPGAIFAHVDDVLASPITPDSGRHPLPRPDDLIEWLRLHGVHRAAQVVVYDDSGGSMAARLWWLLRWLGHEAVAVLDGGWQAWQQAGLPTGARVPCPAAGNLTGAPRPALVMSSAAAVENLATGRYILIDARTAERFRGESEPIDPVAGHVPGALNMPLQENLDSDGRVRPAAELRALYEQLLAGVPAAASACMCGSGVTACHTLLALEIAGLPGSLLYAGSWSEWIRDPARPVATGPR